MNNLSLGRFLEIPNIKDYIMDSLDGEEVTVMNGYLHLSIGTSGNSGHSGWNQEISIYENVVKIYTKEWELGGSTSESWELFDYSGNRIINNSGRELWIGDILLMPSDVIQYTKEVGESAMFGLCNIEFEDVVLPLYILGTHYIVEPWMKIMYPERWDFILPLSRINSDGREIFWGFC